MLNFFPLGLYLGSQGASPQVALWGKYLVTPSGGSQTLEYGYWAPFDLCFGCQPQFKYNRTILVVHPVRHKSSSITSYRPGIEIAEQTPWEAPKEMMRGADWGHGLTIIGITLGKTQYCGFTPFPFLPAHPSGRFLLQVCVSIQENGIWKYLWDPRIQ